jgi:hypothetical protein
MECQTGRSSIVPGIQFLERPEIIGLSRKSSIILIAPIVLEGDSRNNWSIQEELNYFNSSYCSGRRFQK